MLGAFALGVLLGAGSSVLPGPCGLAVIDAARRRGLPRAVATALGAALGDAVYATLGVVGIGHALARHPAVPSVLLAISGAVLIGMGGVHLRRSLGRAPQATPPAGPARSTASVLGGVGVGLLTLLGNPGALITWVVIVGAQLGGVSCLERWCAVAGIATGTFAWFAGVAHLSARGAGHAMQRLTAGVSVMLLAGGVLSLIRAAT